jgi:hypothetical protein
VTEFPRFERFCGEVLDLDLEPFQVKIAEEVFSSRRECVILLLRGNGKSTLLAAPIVAEVTADIRGRQSKGGIAYSESPAASMASGPHAGGRRASLCE